MLCTQTLLSTLKSSNQSFQIATQYPNREAHNATIDQIDNEVNEDDKSTIQNHLLLLLDLNRYNKYQCWLNFGRLLKTINAFSDPLQIWIEFVKTEYYPYNEY